MNISNSHVYMCMYYRLLSFRSAEGLIMLCEP